MTSSGQRRIYYQGLVLVLTFFSYAFYHAARKSFSTVKIEMENNWGLSELFLGTLDTIFMVVYAFGLMVSGQIGDRFSPKVVVVIGMFLTSIALTLFGLAKPWGIHAPAYFIIVWVFNAFVQSSGWPNNVAIMGKWFRHDTRGTVYGIWSANSSAGNIMGSLVSGAILSIADWPYVFYATAGLTLAGAIWMMFLLPASPEDVGELSVDILASDIQSDYKTILEEVPKIKQPPVITFWKAFLVPGVIPYSLCYACTKLVNYSLFFWLPYYLSKVLNFHTDTSALLSTWYDIGGIIGGIIAGFISDIIIRKLNIDRAPVLIVMLVLATGQLYLYFVYAGVSWMMNIFLMTLAGVLIGGPANLISSAVAADLGTRKDIKGNKEAVATITGIVDGTASLGAALGQLSVVAISSYFGWDKVFYFFMSMTGTAALILVLYMYSNYKTKKKNSET